MLKLVKLSKEYKEQLIDMIEEWTEYNNTHNTNHSPWAIFKDDYHDFDYYLENIDFKEDDDNHVKTSTFFLLDTDRNIFLGAVNIRHHLNYNLFIDGGHIGDGIRPSERNKGYATKIIGLTLEECKKIGLRRVLLVCDKDNIGSRKSITNNGGILENEIEVDGNIEQRYWIELYPYNRLEGNHIVLRKARMDDMDIMLKTIWSDEKVYGTMFFKPTFDIEEAKQRIFRSVEAHTFWDAYFVALKDTDKPIGLCGIKEDSPKAYEEAGICIASEYQGLGYGKEVLGLLLDLAFNKYDALSFTYVLMKDNNRSRGIMNKYDFQFEKTTKETRAWDEKEFELEYYKLLKENFKK